MQIRETLDIAGTVDQVLAALADPAFHALRAQRNGALDHSIDVRLHQGELVVDARWVLPSDELPPVARSFLGDRLTLVEQQRWRQDGPLARGTLTERVERVDLNVTADGLLEPYGAGCRQHVTGQIVARIPFMGSQVERAAAPAILRAIRNEAVTASAWISAR